MSILQNAIEHFTSQGRREIDVPEWGCKLYSTTMTLKERAAYSDRYETHKLAAAAWLVVAKATDGEGKPAFAKGDDLELSRKADAAVILRIAGAILEGPSAEDVEKN